MIAFDYIFLVIAPVVEANEEAVCVLFFLRNYRTIVLRFICEYVKAQGNVGWLGGSVMLSVPLSVFALAAWRPAGAAAHCVEIRAIPEIHNTQRKLPNLT